MIFIPGTFQLYHQMTQPALNYQQAKDTALAAHRARLAEIRSSYVLNSPDDHEGFMDAFEAEAVSYSKTFADIHENHNDELREAITEFDKAVANAHLILLRDIYQTNLVKAEREYDIEQKRRADAFREALRRAEEDAEK